LVPLGLHVFPCANADVALIMSIVIIRKVLIIIPLISDAISTDVIVASIYGAECFQLGGGHYLLAPPPTLICRKCSAAHLRRHVVDGICPEFSASNRDDGLTQFG